jgi:hypothetical protein
LFVCLFVYFFSRQSKDHKPLMNSERRRVQLLGGFVSDQGRIQGSGANIAVARAIGTLLSSPSISSLEACSIQYV